MYTLMYWLFDNMTHKYYKLSEISHLIILEFTVEVAVCLGIVLAAWRIFHGS